MKKKSAPEKQIRASDVIEVLRYRNMLKRHHGQKAGDFLFFIFGENTAVMKSVKMLADQEPPAAFVYEWMCGKRFAVAPVTLLFWGSGGWWRAPSITQPSVICGFQSKRKAYSDKWVERWKETMRHFIQLFYTGMKITISGGIYQSINSWLAHRSVFQDKCNSHRTRRKVWNLQKCALRSVKGRENFTVQQLFSNTST